MMPLVVTPVPHTAAASRPALTVIIPCYNIVRYLGRCVESVLAQRWNAATAGGGVEVILVDDGSTDGTAELCDCLAAHEGIHVLHQPNGGPSAARNAGLDAARSETIAFIDGDDVVHERYLELLWQTMQQTGADIVQAPFVLLAEGDRPAYDAARCARPLNSLPTPIVRTGVEALADMLYQRPKRIDSSPCKMFRQTVFRDVRFTTAYHAYEDLLLMVQLLGRPGVRTASLDAPLYFYFKQADGTLNTRSVTRTDAFDVCDRIIADMERNRPAIVPAARSRKLSVAFNILRLLSQQPAGADAEAMTQRCWQAVRTLRRACLTDKNVRIKNKAGILLSYAGRRLTMACFKACSSRCPRHEVRRAAGD